MYLAHMYCYGKHANTVGVTGIAGCLGIFIAHNNMLYAIHIPPNSAITESRAREQFAEYVEGQDGTIKNSAVARLYGVTNRDYRQTAESDLYSICGRLGLRQFRLIRLRSTPTATVQGSNRESIVKDSTAVICRFANGGSPNDCTFICHPDATLKYRKLANNNRAGSYRDFPEEDVDVDPNGLAAWTSIVNGNASMRTVFR